MTRHFKIALPRAMGLIAALLTIAYAGQALAQTTDINPEQQIFTAPLGEIAPAIDEALAEDIVAMCQGAVQSETTLAEPCTAMLTQLVEAYGQAVATDVSVQLSNSRFQDANLAHIRGIFEAQRQQGQYLFWLAMAVVVLGIIASAFQFLKVWKQDVVAQTEISISEKQLSIKTSWIGVVLLAMSMGFFGLYLWFVYTIVPISSAAAG